MNWDQIHDEQPPSDDDRSLVFDNLRRIKDLIYGSGDDAPTSTGSGLGTSDRDRED